MKLYVNSTVVRSRSEWSFSCQSYLTLGRMPHYVSERCLVVSHSCSLCAVVDKYFKYHDNEGWQFWCIQSFLLWSSGVLCYWWLYKLKMLVYLEDCTILIISVCFLQWEISLLTVDCLSIAGMEPVEFHSVTRVGSGYSMYELTELIEKLLPHWQQVIPGQCPPGLVWTKEKPDIWVAPQNSYILEV